MLCIFYVQNQPPFITTKGPRTLHHSPVNCLCYLFIASLIHFPPLLSKFEFEIQCQGFAFINHSYFIARSCIRLYNFPSSHYAHIGKQGKSYLLSSSINLIRLIVLKKLSTKLFANKNICCWVWNNSTIGSVFALNTTS